MNEISKAVAIMAGSDLPGAIAHFAAIWMDNLLAVGFSREEAIRLMTVPGGLKFMET